MSPVFFPLKGSVLDRTDSQSLRVRFFLVFLRRMFLTRLSLLLILCLSSNLFAQAKKAAPRAIGFRSMAVAQVGEHIITSREVYLFSALNQLIDQEALDNKVLNIESDEFAREIRNTLQDWCVFLEAKAFQAVPVFEEDVKEITDKLIVKKWMSNPWQKQYEYSARELRDNLIRVMQARQLMQFRSQASSIPISDSDAQKYYEENRFKFGESKFDSVKDNIKSFLAKSQAEKRMHDWIELLKAKYQTKNYISGL